MSSPGSPGNKVTIVGMNLSEVTTVTIGGVSARIQKRAPTKLIVTVLPGATSSTIVVTSLAGGASSKRCSRCFRPERFVSPGAEAVVGSSPRPG